MSIALNDLERSGLLMTPGTGNDILSGKRARIMKLVASGTSSLVWSIDDAATVVSAIVTVRPQNSETIVIDLEPTGWIVDNISGSVAGTGQVRIFYILEDAT